MVNLKHQTSTRSRPYPPTNERIAVVKGPYMGFHVNLGEGNSKLLKKKTDFVAAWCMAPREYAGVGFQRAAVSWAARSLGFTWWSFGLS